MKTIIVNMARFTLLCLSVTALQAADTLPNTVTATTANTTAADSLYVKQVIVEGSTVFPAEQLDEVITPYQERRLTIADIQELKDKLTLLYISEGYLNSGVIIPQQDLSEGILRYQVIEGRLLALSIDGNKRLRDRYIQRRVLPRKEDGLGKPLNVKQLQERLRLLEQDPRIQRLHANLRPGVRLGEAELDLTIEEARAHYLSATFNNHISPNVGNAQGILSAGHQNLLGYGDSLALDLRFAEGWESYSLEYGFPLNARGTVLSARASDSESEIVVAPFDLLDITSESSSYSLKLRHPVYRTLATEVALALSFEQRRNGSFLLGDPFDFFEGGPGGESRVNVLGLSQEWIYRRLNQVWVAQSRFDFGLDTMDATSSDEPDGVFNAWLGQAQWIRRLESSDSQLFWRFLIRLTDDPMLSSEKFPLGGYATVRGYRENQLTWDNGATTSLEWRVNLGRFPIPGLDSDPNAGELQVIPFIDLGWGSDHEDTGSDPSTIASAGLGLTWSMNRHFSAQVYWAEPQRDFNDYLGNSLQYDGLHLQLIFSY